MTVNDDIGRMANFADTNGDGKSAAEIRKYAKRLAQDRRFASTQGQTGGWVNWGSMAEYLGQPFDVTKIPLSKLEQMRKDPILAFGLMFVKVPLVRAKWDIECSDPQRAAFVKNALGQIYGRFILAYCNSFDYGYSPIIKRFEYMVPDWKYIVPETYKEEDVWPDKNIKALVWKPFIPINPRSAVPHWNAKGEFSGIDIVSSSSSTLFGSSHQRGLFGDNDGRAADVPLDWALWATNEKDSEFNSLWGYPRIGYAYRFWWSYWYKFGLSDRAFEKWGDPPVVVFHPADEDVQDSAGETVDFGQEALNVAEQLRSGANVAMPSSVIRGYDERHTSVREWDLKTMETTANFEALNKSFEYLDVQKLRSVMVPEQALIEGKGGSSSRNVAEEFGNIFQESQAVVMEEIDDLINRYMIPQLLEANFGPGGPSCRKVTTGFDPADIETMRSLVGAMANKNGEIASVDMEGVLHRLGVPQLTHAAIERRLNEMAQHQDAIFQRDIEKRKIEAQLKGHKVDFDDEGREIIVLSDDERGTLRKIFDKLLGREPETTIEEKVEE